MRTRYPTTRSRLSWASTFAVVAATWFGALCVRALMRDLPRSTGSFDGMHLER